ncbi:MAG: hypothetical protein JSS82_08705 [Bacteroidetes bacterium]|nr:hypothetical protein [Bacteroidota bacterium]
MYKYLYFAAALAMSVNSFAQSGVSVHSNGIYNNNALYAKLDKTGTTNAGYSVKLPKGQEVLNARYDDWLHSYIVTFPESGQQIAMKSDPNFEQKLAKGVVESNMIVGGQYNPRSEGYFMSKYGYGSIPPVDKQEASQQVPVSEKSDYTTVERNRKMPYVGSDSYVKQDGKVITTYKVESINTGGKPAKKFTFYLPNGTKVAEVTIVQVKDGECKVHTMKDDKEVTIGMKNNDNITSAREIAIFLSDKRYL